MAEVEKSTKLRPEEEEEDEDDEAPGSCYAAAYRGLFLCTS
jgi:hypothetical protein